ncbi:MAG: PQQ-dependent sugar dehydrogenase [Oleiphilaceae bacterium]|nr:PQQ-dependent sugar dehydrogenase [Oleiphilaceae bacterium]
MKRHSLQIRLAGALIALLLPTAPLHAHETRIETVVEGLDRPWSLAFLPDGDMLVTERSGQLRRIEADGTLVRDPVKGLPEDIYVDGQGGLMDVVLDPAFEENRRIFISYSCGTRKANHTCLGRAVLGENALEEFREIFRAQPAKQGSAHYGGRIAFLPDRTLLLTIGDGFDYREKAQNKSDHLGSIVRLDRDGQAPDDNPFLGEPAARKELYSIGHRNPQGLLHDPASGRVYSHEHGPRGGDEINVIEAGNNYGWPVITYGVDYNGAQISPLTEKEGMEQPIVVWTPSIAPSGMTLYDGDLFPDWQGDLFSGALAKRKVQRVMLEGGEVQGEEALFEDLNRRIRDVRTGPDGALYLLTDHGNGELLRVVPKDH